MANTVTDRKKNNMFSTIRKHFGYTNIAVTLALVFAMTGGAYAASKYLITSTKQISPKVLKALAGKPGPKGSAGAVGAAGPAGARGETGAPGGSGKEGVPGKDGVNGESVIAKEVKTSEAACGKQGGSSFAAVSTTTFACNGREGKEGSPWTAGGMLPSGKSEKGVWAATYEATAAGQPMASPISFTIPLKAAPETYYIGTEEELAGEKNEAAAIKEGKCKGNSNEPEAASGNVCVFATAALRATTWTPQGSQVHFIETGPQGTVFVVGATEAGTVISWGRWVVTG